MQGTTRYRSFIHTHFIEIIHILDFSPVLTLSKSKVFRTRQIGLHFSKLPRSHKDRHINTHINTISFVCIIVFVLSPESPFASSQVMCC